MTRISQVEAAEATGATDFGRLLKAELLERHPSRSAHADRIGSCPAQIDAPPLVNGRGR